MDISELYKLFLKHPVVTTDSRDCPKDSIFFALKGTSFNGNEFAGSALEKGCAYAVIDQTEYQIQQDERYILVEDCLCLLYTSLSKGQLCTMLFFEEVVWMRCLITCLMTV